MATTTECSIAKCRHCRGTGHVCDNCAAPEGKCSCSMEWGMEQVKCHADGQVTCNGTGEVCVRHRRARREGVMAMTCSEGTTGVFA